MCGVDCPALLRKLIAAGADIDSSGGREWATPLCYAAAAGNAESIKVLLDAGANVISENQPP
jgi:ankyrin repeat protein